MFRDKTPPALGTPALALDPSSLDGEGHARSLDVRLVFDVRGDRQGEQLFVAVANGPGLDAGASFVPLASPLSHRLAEGDDGLARQVCALFKDEAGLLSEQQCLTVAVDRSGSLRGTVRLEDGADPAGVVVTLGRKDELGVYQETGLTAVAGTDGGFMVPKLSLGTSRFERSHPGY